MLTTQIPGDIIHLLGYYPPNPTTTTERPRPLYKPVYTYPKPSTTITTSNTNTFSHHTNQYNQHSSPSSSSPHRPTSWDHETNHISSSPSFYPLVHPDEHFGIVDEEGFGAEAEAAVFSHNHNSYGDFSNKPTTYADEEYRPFQGIASTNIFIFFSLSLSHTFFSLVILVDMTPLVFDWLQTKLHANTNTPNYTRRRKKNSRTRFRYTCRTIFSNLLILIWINSQRTQFSHNSFCKTVYFLYQF